MKEMIAYCGLDCEKCDAYIATQNDDDELRAEVAKLWSQLNQVEITPEMINCDGCKADGRKTVFCDSLCEIRKCAMEKSLGSCGGCGFLMECEKIKMIIDNNDEALERLK